MKTLLSCALLTLAACGTTSHYEMPSEEAYTEMLMTYGPPGPEHEQMAALVGDWDVEMVMRMAPGGDPMPAAAQASYRLDAGGLFVVETYDSDFMGTPFHGELVMGFNRVNNTWWALWRDSMSNWPGWSTGPYTTAGEIITEGVVHDPITPEGRAFRTETRGVGTDTLTFTYYDTAPDGSMWKPMEMTYTRKG